MHDSKCRAGGSCRRKIHRDTNVTMTTSIVDITCNHSSMQIQFPSTSTSFASIPAEVVEMRLTGCKTPFTGCTATIKNLPYAFHVETSAMTLTDATGAGAYFDCGFLINCELRAKEMSWSVSHGTAGVTFAASEQTLERNGGFCPETATLDATYSLPNITIN
jgi:hypothetical protein